MKEEKLAKWLEEKHKTPSKSGDAGIDRVLDTVDGYFVEDVDSGALFENIKTAIKPAENPTKTVNIRWIASGIAAMVVAIYSVVVVMNNEISIQTQPQEYTTHILPDQSTVTINSSSIVSYEKSFEKNRSLHLSGEAFFEVQKGKQFTVHTDLGAVQVLGTSFNVFARKQILEVSCKTGKVAVNSGANKLILQKGERAILKNKLLQKDKVSEAIIGQWSDDESVFENDLLSKVMSAYSSYYDIEILDPDYLVKDQLYTGSFIHSDMDKAIKMILLPMDIKFKFETETTLILHK